MVRSRVRGGIWARAWGSGDESRSVSDGESNKEGGKWERGKGANGQMGKWAKGKAERGKAGKWESGKWQDQGVLIGRHTPRALQRQARHFQ